MNNQSNTNNLVLSRKLLIEPSADCPWASEMVLNPGIVQDPETKRLHMLFRATGPCPELQSEGKPLPFPIFLGYAWSDDLGENWEIDWEKPALAPLANSQIEGIKIKDLNGELVTNYSNGCIEDPRVFFLDDGCYLIAACRMFPPGPYWINDEPMQCAPEWASGSENPYGKAASENYTVNVLYKIDLKKLASKDYDAAFSYVTHLTDPECGENRDVVLFPNKLNIAGKEQYVCLHRPWSPAAYGIADESTPPSIAICHADKLSDLSTNATHSLLCAPRFDWEKERMGASGPLLQLSPNEWLMSCHGKHSTERGYTQSFMILSQSGGQVPTIKHRCPLEIMRAEEPWEMPDKFKSPVVFITGVIEVEGKLLVAYGGADQRVGIAWLDLEKLLETVRQYDAEGKLIS